MKISQKDIIAAVKTNSLVTKNANDSFEIISAFERLDRSKNYAFMFQKTSEYWSDKNWHTVASDIQAHLYGK